MNYNLDGICQDCIYLEKIKPLFEEKELETFDNNIQRIVEEYCKMTFKEKEQILIQRLIKKQQQEIEKLNNIIEELEKWLKDIDIFQMDFIENKDHITPYKAVLDKLKELKEGK